MKVERKYQGQESHYEVTGLEVGEPIFVLRGRDSLALEAIFEYRARLKMLGLMDSHKEILLDDIAKDFVKYGATAQLRFPD